MFLEFITLTRTLPCLADPGRLIVVGKPSCPLDEVLPYLAALPNVISFSPSTPALTLRQRPGLITLQSAKVYITQVSDVAEGLQLLDALTDLINVSWAHREALGAVTAPRQAPRMLDVWRLLPRTNCRLCGEATCMAFAFGLLQQRRTLPECPPLQSDATQLEHRLALERLF